jgi:hypothetical protein
VLFLALVFEIMEYREPSSDAWDNAHLDY